MTIKAKRLKQIRQLLDEIGNTWANEQELHQAFAISAADSAGQLPPFEPDELERLLQAVFAARDLLAAYDALTRPQPEPPMERVLSEELEEELLQHPGRWVAMTREKIIALGDTPAEVFKAALSAGHKTPILYQVPKPGMSFFY